MKLKKNITLAEQERCDGDMMSISKNYLTQFNLHSRTRPFLARTSLLAPFCQYQKII
jgi:hypothetical protein